MTGELIPEVEKFVMHVTDAFNYAMASSGIEFGTCSPTKTGYVDDDAIKVCMALLAAGWTPPKEVPE